LFISLQLFDFFDHRLCLVVAIITLNRRTSMAKLKINAHKVTFFGCFLGGRQRFFDFLVESHIEFRFFGGRRRRQRTRSVGRKRLQALFRLQGALKRRFYEGPSFLSAELSLTSSEIISEKSGLGKLEPGGGWGESTIEISGRTRPASASIFSQTTFNWNRHISRGNHQSKMRCNNLPVSHL
jgi:hypothetical protein